MPYYFRHYLDRKGPLNDALAFVFVAIFAIALDWRARDIAWALWISSLCVGYITCIWVLFRQLIPNLINAGRGKKVAFAVFMTLFFTMHFGGFHYVHSIFLNSVLPLKGSDDSFPGIFTIIRSSFASYWPLVLAAFFSRVAELRSLSADTKHMGIVLPYINVVRLHCLIAVLAILYNFGLGWLALYPVLAAVFFPWGVFFKFCAGKLSERRNRAIARESEHMAREMEAIELQDMESGPERDRDG
jgi:hypothetical protein